MPKTKTIRPRFIRSGQALTLMRLFWRKGRGEFVPLTRRELDDAMRAVGLPFERELWHDMIDAELISVKPIYGGRKEHIETICTLTAYGRSLLRELERSSGETQRRVVKPASRYYTAPWLDPMAIRVPVRAVSK